MSVRGASLCAVCQRTCELSLRTVSARNGRVGAHIIPVVRTLVYIPGQLTQLLCCMARTAYSADLLHGSVRDWL